MHAYITMNINLLQININLFSLDLGSFVLILKKPNFELLSFAMFEYSNDYLNLKYKLKKKQF